MSGYESPTPDAEVTPSEGPDAGLPDGGDATGGGDPGDPDAMGADDSPQPGERPEDETTEELS